jgi:hypothetical protein
VQKTIHPTFWKDRVRTIGDWSPPLFKAERAGLFRDLIRTQKVLAMSVLYEFCFKELKAEDDGRKVYALDRSILTGKNLFIRGPLGSGRGLLAASIKMQSAARDISTTPLPSEFSALRGMLHEYESYGAEREITRSIVHDSFVGVKLMFLEDIHCETKTLGRQNVIIKSKYANTFDSIFAKRAQQEGAMVFTSSDFAGEIGDSIGDKLQEILESDSTYQIIMVSPVEADALLRSLRARKNMFSIQLTKLLNEEKTKKKTSSKGNKAMIEGIEEGFGVESIKEGFYFEEAFPNIPGETPEIHMVANESCSSEIKEKYEEFIKEKNESPRGLSYYNGLNTAIVNAVGACKELSGKMTHREMKLIGQMMSVATQADNSLNEKVQYAIKLRNLMDGKSDDSGKDGAP